MQTNKLIFGLCLVAVGVAAFLGAIDAWHIRHAGRYWPLIMVAFGVAGEIDALRRRRIDGSYALLAVGCWFTAGFLHLFGLTVGSALPIGLVVAGFFLVLHALIDRPEVKGQENDHVC